MSKLAYDLHIHSCLSPCGDEDMTPSNIVNMSQLVGLGLIAVTDHCSCKNCPAVLKLAEQADIIAIPGMELTTAEEVHVVCLFPSLERAMEFDDFVNKTLVVQNHPEIFGYQKITDVDDNVIGVEEKLLIQASGISFDEIDGIVKKYAGFYFPAHLDRTSNSLISNLGFIPEESKFTAFELKHIGYEEEYRQKYPYLKPLKMFTNSDAHYLENLKGVAGEFKPCDYLEDISCVEDFFKQFAM